jgi:hypothetical protein
VLINVVLSTLPVYFMLVFQIPQWVIAEIDKVRKIFLWQGIDPYMRKLYLANLELVCTPKSMGGLRIIDLKIFNTALLYKWY